jgi:hypothetical protein
MKKILKTLLCWSLEILIFMPCLLVLLIDIIFKWNWSKNYLNKSNNAVLNLYKWRDK